MSHPIRNSLILAIAGMATLASASRSAPLDLDEAVRRALAAHPALRAARLETRAAAARVRDAARRPAPSLSAELEDLGGRAGVDGAQATLVLAQPLELGGDRSARAGAARATMALAEAGATALEREVAAEATEAFLDAWLAEQRVARERAAEPHTNEAVRAAGERLRAGAAPASERARAELFAALRAIERRRAEAARGGARRRLARTWGMDSLDADSLALTAPPHTAPAAAEVLLARLTVNPERRRAEAETEAAAWRVREARAARTADLDASAGVRRLPESGGTALVASISLPLPLWGRADGEVEAASAERDAVHLREEATARRLAQELRGALDELRAAEEAWETARGALSAAADEALTSVTAAYRSGRSGYPEIAESQRTRLEVEVVRAEALAALWRARTAVERLTGMPLEAAEEGR